MDVDPPKCLITTPLTVPTKILMGPGPSNAPARVLAALSNPILGHLHTETLQMMDEIKEGCRYIFQTTNPVTLCVSASGHGAMEMSLCNLIEDGDVVLVAVTGIWGQRAGDMARRCGGDVRFIESGAPGSVLAHDRIEEYMRIHKPVVFFITQGDSSTGILQPIEGLGDLCQKYDCLLIVDTVASLGGAHFYADRWKVDVAYTGAQKVIGAPAGLTPITFGPRAMAKIANRNTPVKVYYFDVNLLGDYWNCFGRPRYYHHTIAATLVYGLREALALFCAEGIEASVARHKVAAERLYSGLTAIGLELFVEREADRLPTVTAIKVPTNVDWKKVSEYAMKNNLVEISGGLGPTAGQVFRIGLMGVNATTERVDLILQVFRQSLQNTSSFVSKI